jgi:ribose transport system substrate-binding protein
MNGIPERSSGWPAKFSMRYFRPTMWAVFALFMSSTSLVLAQKWDGPTRGPLGQREKRIVFLASDARNGGVTGVYRSFEEAVEKLGWKVAFMDGGGEREQQAKLLGQALTDHPDGLVFGGFDASEFKDWVASAKKHRIALVGWHAAKKPGPTAELFSNIATSSEAVVALATGFVIKDAEEHHQTAGIIVFTDSNFAVARAKTDLIVRMIKGQPLAMKPRILAIEDIPISNSSLEIPAMVPKLIARFGRSWNYSIAINDVYFDNINFPLAYAHRDDILNVSAGDGSGLALSRISAGHSQQAATVAEPLRMQGYQLADELNRAFAGVGPSGYVSRPILVTTSLLRTVGSAGIEANLGFEAAYSRIWAGK